MSTLTENIYDINDLYIVKLGEDYKRYLPNNSKGDELEDVEYFNSNIYYIVERCLIENKPSGFHEFYTECIVGRDLFYRIIERKDENIPEIFKEIYEFPKEYFSKEELKHGKITTSRVFQIFQEINFSKTIEDNKEKTFVKRI